MEFTMTKKKVDMTKMEIGVMCEELLEEIFTRVPIKPLVRMKCVSEGWCYLISSHVQRRKDTSSSGLFVHYLTSRGTRRRSRMHDMESHLTFHDMKFQGIETNCIERDSLSFALEHNWFLGSCNGLLLCCCYWGGRKYVCSPILDQWLLLPPANESMQIIGSTGGIGLAYDGLPDHHYKVVYYYSSKSNPISNLGFLQCTIFSSKTGKWSTHRAKLLNGLLMQNFSDFDPAPFFFLEGAIHWIRSGYILVYHVEKDFFEIEELPMKRLEQQGALSARCGSGLEECLWDAEGSLHYCHAYHNLIHIWAHGESGTDHARTLGKWQLKFKLALDTTDYRYPKLINCLDRIPTFSGYGQYYATLTPCGFNENLQVFYFRLSGHVYTYSFETQVTKNVCTYEYNYAEDSSSRRFKAFPFVFNPLRLPVGGESKLVMLKKESSQITGRPRLVLK